MGTATYSAAAINAAVALVALALGTRSQPPRPQKRDEGAAPLSPTATGAVLVYIAIAVSGLTALGAEVVWTRLLSLLLGATVYTFSIILAVFLLGLWAGSGAGSYLVRRIRHPRLALATTQVLLAAALAETAYTVTYLLPYWPVDPWLSMNPWFIFDLDMVRCIRTIFPATLLWGASFPMALASAAAEGQDPARLSGETYAANTAGSIVGALSFSLVLIPSIGTRGSQQLLIVLSLTGALLAFGSFIWTAHKLPKIRLAATVAATIALAWGLASTVSDVPWQMIAYGRRVAPILRGLDPSSE